MATYAPVKKITYALPPQGTHIARVYRFMNLGTRLQEYKGEPKATPDTLVSFTLELPNEIHEFEYENKETGQKEKVSKPFVVSREFTLSMGKKANLRPFVEGIIGTKLSDEEAGEFDLEQLVGMVCQATVVHEQGKTDPDRKFANLSSVAPLMKGVEAPPPVNEPIIQDVNKMSEAEIDALPDFLQKKIKVSDEYKARFLGAEIESDELEIDAESIPF